MPRVLQVWASHRRGQSTGRTIQQAAFLGAVEQIHNLRRAFTTAQTKAERIATPNTNQRTIGTNKQTNKQTTQEQPYKQTNKQTNKQANQPTDAGVRRVSAACKVQRANCDACRPRHAQSNWRHSRRTRHATSKIPHAKRDVRHATARRSTSNVRHACSLPLMSAARTTGRCIACDRAISACTGRRCLCACVRACVQVHVWVCVCVCARARARGCA